MQDPHIDIAMFAIYALYDRRQIGQLIQYYFDGDALKTIVMKIYACIAVCDLLWRNWCEYKCIKGTGFGEYALYQYYYAKEYYRIVKKEMEELDDVSGR